MNNIKQKIKSVNQRNTEAQVNEIVYNNRGQLIINDDTYSTINKEKISK